MIREIEAMSAVFQSLRPYWDRLDGTNNDLYKASADTAQDTAWRMFHHLCPDIDRKSFDARIQKDRAERTMTGLSRTNARFDSSVYSEGEIPSKVKQIQ